MLQHSTAKKTSTHGQGRHQRQILPHSKPRCQGGTLQLCESINTANTQPNGQCFACDLNDAAGSKCANQQAMQDDKVGELHWPFLTPINLQPGEPKAQVSTHPDMSGCRVRGNGCRGQGQHHNRGGHCSLKW